MKSILVPVEDHDSMEAVLSTALLLARPFESYVEGIPLGPDIAEMVAADFSMSGVIFDDRTRRSFLRHAAETFEGFMARENIPRRSDEAKGLTFGWLGENLVSPTSVGEYGRVFDLIAVGRPGAASTSRIARPWNRRCLTAAGLSSSHRPRRPRRSAAWSRSPGTAVPRRRAPSPSPCRS